MVLADSPPKADLVRPPVVSKRRALPTENGGHRGSCSGVRGSRGHRAKQRVPVGLAWRPVLLTRRTHPSSRNGLNVRRRGDRPAAHAVVAVMLVRSWQAIGVAVLGASCILVTIAVCILLVLLVLLIGVQRGTDLSANIRLVAQHALVRVDEPLRLPRILRAQALQLALHIAQLPLPVLLGGEEEADEGDKEEDLHAGGRQQEARRRPRLGGARGAHPRRRKHGDVIRRAPKPIPFFLLDTWHKSCYTVPVSPVSVHSYLDVCIRECNPINARNKSSTAAEQLSGASTDPRRASSTNHGTVQIWPLTGVSLVATSTAQLSSALRHPDP